MLSDADLLNGNAAGSGAAPEASWDVLQSRISQLEQRLQELSNPAMVQKTALSPIHPLPAEILSEIFLLVIPKTVLGDAERKEFQNLNLVCRGWREASLLTHRLWSGITIGPMDTNYERIVTWLGQSGKLPKTLEYIFTRPYREPLSKCECSEPGKPCFSANAVLARLLIEGPVLKHFKLECATPKCFLKWTEALEAASAVGGSWTEPMPWEHLDSFSLTFSQIQRTPWNQSEDPVQSVFNRLPQTSSFRLELPPLWAAFTEPEQSITAHLHIPPSFLNKLTTLMVDSEWLGTHVLDMLQHCEQLERLILNTNDTSPDDAATTRLEVYKEAPIVLPKLHTLRFDWIDHVDYLKYIRTPALRHLGLHWANRVDPLPDRLFATTLFDFIKESHLEDTLESLHISDLCTMVEMLAYVLSPLWGLQTLTLERVRIQGVWAMWQGFQHRAKAAESEPRIEPPFRGREYLPSMRNLTLLEIPDEYRLECVGIYLAARKDGVPCRVVISYQQRERRSRRQADFLKLFCTNDRGISSVTIL